MCIRKRKKERRNARKNKFRKRDGIRFPGNCLFPPKSLEALSALTALFSFISHNLFPSRSLRRKQQRKVRDNVIESIINMRTRCFKYTLSERSDIFHVRAMALLYMRNDNIGGTLQHKVVFLWRHRMFSSWTSISKAVVLVWLVKKKRMKVPQFLELGVLVPKRTCFVF